MLGSKDYVSVGKKIAYAKAVVFSKSKKILQLLFKRTCRHKNRAFQILPIGIKVVRFTWNIWYPLCMCLHISAKYEVDIRSLKS